MQQPTSTDDTKMPRPVGSPFEEALLAHVSQHVDAERAVLAGYVELAESSPDEYVRYLASLILDDERRHHQRFVELRNRILSDITWRETIPRTPRVTIPDDREALIRQAERYIAVEERDAEELRRLRREVRPMKDTSLLSLMVELMELDTEKHLRILRFIRQSAR
jgi:hypothetical protein